MHRATLALLGLLLATTPGFAAPPERGTGGQARAAAPRGAVASAHRARPVVAVRVDPRRRGQAAGARHAMHWTSGLSPAMGEQASACPAGTMALLAMGHSDVIRCMPI